MNSVTVGSGGTYADWAAFLTALVAASPLSDDWDVLQVSDITGAITAAMAAGY